MRLLLFKGAHLEALNFSEVAVIFSATENK